MAAGTLTSDQVNYLIWRYVVHSKLMVDPIQPKPFADLTIRKGICRNQVTPTVSYDITKGHGNTENWFSGHGDAAVKLQRDWLLDPQSLPFAQHIKTHALVSLIQKGLQYYQIEQSLGQVSHNAQSITTPSQIT